MWLVVGLGVAGRCGIQLGVACPGSWAAPSHTCHSRQGKKGAPVVWTRTLHSYNTEGRIFYLLTVAVSGHLS